ncbi:MAG: chemotaxis protein CheW [Novosphingobium sp.]|nr:chemotaxis protein CheW [Novosphingobium sp.]
MSAPLLIVKIAGDRIAVPAERVHSVIELSRIVPVPRAPRFIAGLTTLRSRTLTVIDTACALGLPESTEIAEFALVVESDGCGYALMVEAVENVESGEPAPCRPDVKLADGWKRAAQGLVETEAGSLLVIDLDMVIAGPLQDQAA